MKLFFDDCLYEGGKSTNLVIVELTKLVNKRVYSIGRLLIKIKEFLRSYVEIFTDVEEG